MEDLEKKEEEKKVMSNYMLFFIPSWSELLGYPVLGNYANQKVARIISNPVIFLSGAEYAVQTDSGTNYYLFGLGYYHLKFEIETGTSQLQYDKYIVDNRQLSCLCISDFIYDFIATAKNVTLEDALAHLEREMLIDALKNTRGNISKAAMLLQTTVRKFSYKAMKYSVDYRQYR